MPANTITILIIRNIGNQPLPVSVGPVSEEDVYGTDVTDNTPFDGDLGFFQGSGTAKIFPGKSFEIEEYRVNLGQIQNYIDLRQAQVFTLERSISALQEETG